MCLIQSFALWLVLIYGFPIILLHPGCIDHRIYLTKVNPILLNPSLTEILHAQRVKGWWCSQPHNSNAILQFVMWFQSSPFFFFFMAAVDWVNWWHIQTPEQFITLSMVKQPLSDIEFWGLEMQTLRSIWEDSKINGLQRADGYLLW